MGVIPLLLAEYWVSAITHDARQRAEPFSNVATEINSIMKKTLRVIILMSFVASSILFSNPANAGTNDLTPITAADAVALLTSGSSDITVVPGSEVAYGSLKSFSSINLSPGFEMPQSGIFINSTTSSGADNTSNTAALRGQLGAILADAGVTGYGGNVTNVSALSFNFTANPSIQSLEFDFLFASAEGFQQDWDIAAVIVDGVNYARLQNGTILRVREASNLCNFDPMWGPWGWGPWGPWDPNDPNGPWGPWDPNDPNGPWGPWDPNDPNGPWNQFFNQNPDPACQNIALSQNQININNDYLRAAAPAGRIGALLDPSLTTHSITFAVGDTGDEIVPSYLMFSLVQGSIQTFGGFGGILDSGFVDQTSTDTAPSAPTSVVATSTGKRSATVSFKAPESNGGRNVSSYEVTASPGGLVKGLRNSIGGTVTFDALEPGTAYTFAVTATNAIGKSAAAVSNSIKTDSLFVASISSLTFADDGTGTGGKIVWAGKNIDAVLFTGPEIAYPGPFNYGAFTSGWNGRIRNLTADTSYTVSLFAVSSDGLGESKSLTFKTSAALPAPAGAASATISRADEMTAQLPKLFAWIDENVFVDGEGDRMKMMINKFNAIVAPKTSAYLKLPKSSVVSVSATSSTPLVCTVEGQVTVRSIAAGTCTISYTVSGASKAPATMVKDFVFKKFAK
jgi:Fibronectin type III domain